MRILWSIHLYPPVHNAGAEYVAHSVNQFLHKRGHQIRVLLHQGESGISTYEGIEVFGPPERRGFSMDAYAWGDVICTHLDFTQHSINMGRYNNRPVVNFIHNDCPYPSIIQAKKKQYAVYNSQWIKEALTPIYNAESMVLCPPCQKEKYITGTDPQENKFITLININENKGGYVLYNLAREMPHKQFLAIIGSYEDGGRRPDILAKLESLSNVTIEPQTSDPKSIYARTRILLVPSRYESWGRVATEAMINGIPVIACPTKGLKENCNGAALYIPDRGDIERNNQGEIVKCDEDYDVRMLRIGIESLDDVHNYNRYSNYGLIRADMLEEQRYNQLNQLENFLEYAKQDYKNRPNRKVV